MRFSLIVSLFIGVGFILVTACIGSTDVVDPLSLQDKVAALPSGLSGHDTIGQTFIFHYPRLHSIQVRWAVSDDLEYSPSSRITFHVRRSVDDVSDIAISSVALSDIRTSDSPKFDFPSIQDSQDQSYYFFLDATQAEIKRGSIRLWASGEDDYPDGQLYWNGIPTEQDLAFRAFYEPDLPFVLRSLKRMLGERIADVSTTLFVFLVPGLLLLFISKRFGDHSLVETMGIAGGLSLAILSSESILLLWLGGSINWLTLTTLVAFLALLAGCGLKVARRIRRHTGLPAVRSIGSPNLAQWGLAILSILSICIGLIEILDLPVPLWVDSPRHAWHIKTFIDQGHLPVENLYHLGYHSIVTLIVRLTGTSIPHAMFVVGQLLITQVGISVFLLSKRMSGSDLGALASAICIWFLSPTPSYFITWGRYPLLMGAALLPIALFFAIKLIEQPHFDPWTCFFAAVTCVGLAFAHVRMVGFYVGFILVYLMYCVWCNHSYRYHKLSVLYRISLVAGVVMFFGAIWLGSLVTHDVSLQTIVAQNAEGAPTNDPYYALLISLRHRGPEVWGFALLAVIVGLLRRHKWTLIVLGWFIVLYASSLIPQNMIGGPYLPTSLIVLMAFLPAALVIGELVCYTYSKAVALYTQHRHARIEIVWVAALSVVSILGARDMISIVNPVTIVFSSADMQAMTWIKGHTLNDAKFLVDAFGGSWIPTLTDRRVDFADGTLASASYDSEEMARQIGTREIDLIYFGRRAGILTKAEFACQPNRYELVYDRGGVEIFKVRDIMAQEESAVSVPAECGR